MLKSRSVYPRLSLCSIVYCVLHPISADTSLKSKVHLRPYSKRISAEMRPCCYRCVEGRKDSRTLVIRPVFDFGTSLVLRYLHLKQLTLRVVASPASNRSINEVGLRASAHHVEMVVHSTDNRSRMRQLLIQPIRSGPRSCVQCPEPKCQMVAEERNDINPASFFF